MGLKKPHIKLAGRSGYKLQLKSATNESSACQDIIWPSSTTRGFLRLRFKGQCIFNKIDRWQLHWQRRWECKCSDTELN